MSSTEGTAVALDFMVEGSSSGPTSTTWRCETIFDEALYRKTVSKADPRVCRLRCDHSLAARNIDPRALLEPGNKATVRVADARGLTPPGSAR